MIVSITFRHGTGNRILKHYIHEKCLNLGDLVPSVSRAKVVFNKQHQLRSKIEMVTCHISVRANNKQHFDVYKQLPGSRFAFDLAFESLTNIIFRSNAVEFNRSLSHHA